MIQVVQLLDMFPSLSAAQTVIVSQLVQHPHQCPFYSWEEMIVAMLLLLDVLLNVGILHVNKSAIFYKNNELIYVLFA